MPTATKAKSYTVTFFFNGEEVTKKTEDINAALVAVKPEMLHTDVFVTVKRGDYFQERRLGLFQARRLFNDDTTREVFVNNLLLE